MKIIVLGSGTMTSAFERNPAGYFLENENHLALLDCGPGILRQLKMIQADLLAIDTIFLSHFHLDHCADVFPLLMNRFLLDPQSNTHLQIVAPAGLVSWFTGLASTQSSWLANCPPTLQEIQQSVFQWAGMDITVCPTKHTTNSVAYRFDGKISLFYSGDTGLEADVVNFARGARTGILECSHPDENPQPGHLTPAAAAEFAVRAGFTRLVLTHFYPENDAERAKQIITAKYQGEIIVAQDFLELDM